jgi:hypothetical protein
MLFNFFRYISERREHSNNINVHRTQEMTEQVCDVLHNNTVQSMQ